jgi:hypothetical protein
MRAAFDNIGGNTRRRGLEVSSIIKRQMALCVNY